MLLHQIFNDWSVFQLLLDEKALRSGPAFFDLITKGVIHKFLSVKRLKVDLWPLINRVL